MGDHADELIGDILEMGDDGFDEEGVWFGSGRKPAPIRPRCQYCGKDANLVIGKHVYPHRPDLYHLELWRCDPCDAHVGTFDNGDPRGPLANARLRKMRMEAHKAFDPIWKGGEMSRKEAYRWLADQLGVTKKEAHIGSSDEEFCQRVIELCAR